MFWSKGTYVLPQSFELNVLVWIFLDPGHGDEQQSEPQEKTIGCPTDDNSQPVMEEKAAGIEPSHEVTPRKGLLLD